MDMIPFNNYNVANNGEGEIVAQHEVVALEVKRGPEVAIGGFTLKPEGKHGIALYGAYGKAGVVYPSGHCKQIDRKGV